MKRNEDFSSRKMLVRSFGLAGVMMLFGCAQSISAQWSPTASPTPAPGTNIYYNSGNVGIGTASPGEKLDVNGTFRSSGQNSAPASGAGIEVSYGGGVGYIQSYDRSSGLNKALYVSGSTIQLNAGGEGNVGIGMLSPVAKLDITTVPYDSLANIKANISSNAINLSSSYNGSSYAPGITWTATNLSVVHPAAGIWAFMSGGGSYLHFGTSNTYAGITNTAMTIDYSGNVGIGTTSPGDTLTVNGNLGLGSNKIYNGAANNSAGIDFGTAGLVNLSGFSGIVFNSSAAGIGSQTERMRITNSGTVGIGTSTPNSQYKLDINGSINVSGNINAKYQDVAEWVPSSEQLPAGTVVVLDSTKSNQVISSTQSYDTRVAGVVSAQPGIALGESSTGKVLVATTGRVLVNVDASQGPIHIGDLLVTSDIPGVAMKSEPIMIGNRKMHMPGTLIGKALEPFENGSGKILVLLSLQ